MLHRTIIVPKAKQALSQSLCAGLAGNAGAGMFVVGLSATGNAPATHFISSGLISDDMAYLLPCTSVSTGAEGEPVITTDPGHPELVPAIAAEKEITVTLAAVNALYAAIDVSDQDAMAALDRLGLRLVQTPL